MNTPTLSKVFIMPRKLKTYMVLILALLGIILAILALGMANDQAAVAQELSQSVVHGPVAVVINVIDLFI